MNAIKMAEEIWYFEDALDDPEEVLNLVIDWDSTQNQDYMLMSRINTKSYLEATDDAIFKCLDVWYKNHVNLSPAKYRVAQHTFIHKRGPGGGYGPHTDFIAMPDGTYEQVTATILAYLYDPDSFEGGEIFFPDYDVTIKPKRGSVVIFGSKVKHGVKDVISGERSLASVFLVKDKHFYKDMGASDPKNPTAEEIRDFEIIAPQYEVKNANIDIAESDKDVD